MKNDPSTTWSSRVGAIVFIMLGTGALFAAFWQSMQTKRFLDRAINGTGRVVVNPGQIKNDSNFHPTIEFRTPDMRVVRYRQKGMSARDIGAEIPILYDPSAPEETVVARNFWTLWFPVLGPLIVGLGLLIVPLLGIEIGVTGARP